MDQSFTHAKDAAIALKNLAEAKDLHSKVNYSFKDVERLLLKASDHNISAYVELAKLYEKHGIFDEALKWYMRKYNHSMLENEDIAKLASWYEQGIGTEIDYNMAVKLYTRIAFIHDEALKGAIRLYKNKDIDYVRNLAPGQMTFEKWEDEARKRGIIKESQIDEQTLQDMSNDFWATSDNDDEIIKNLGKSEFSVVYVVTTIFYLLVAAMIGFGVSDILERIYEVNNEHWFSAVSIILLSGGFCSFVPILAYSILEIKGSSITTAIGTGFIGGALVPIFTGFEHMDGGISGIFIISATMALVEYKASIKEHLQSNENSRRID